MPWQEVDSGDAPQSVVDITRSHADKCNASDQDLCAALFSTHNETSTDKFFPWESLCDIARNPYSFEKNRTPCIAPQLTGVKKLKPIAEHDEMSLQWLDIDKGNHSLSKIKEMLEAAGIEKAIIYSTSSATRLHDKTGEQCGYRWRILILTSRPVTTEEWVMIQKALTRLLGGDESATRIQQILYAPNIPPGRGDYYEFEIIEGDPLNVDLLPAPINNETNLITREQEVEARECLEQTKAALAARRRPKPAGFTIDDANQALGSALQLAPCYGFTTTCKNRYISPLSSSGTAGFIVFDDDRWFSHHQSDREAGLGIACESGCCGDAFDLYAYFEHDNNTAKALKTIADEVDPIGQRQRQYDYAASQQLPRLEGEAKDFKFEPFSIGPEFLKESSDLPLRPWIVEKHLIRGYVSATFGPGGVGKSVFELAKAISVATGKDLLGLGVKERCKVLIINNEDDDIELKRRIAGIMLSHDIKPEELEGRLFVDSGYGSPFQVAWQQHGGIVGVTPHLNKLATYIQANNIGLVSIDPFISTHSVNENDNTAIDQVIGMYKRLAHETQTGVSIVHHTRKIGRDSEEHAGDAESGRGASSLKDAARCVDTLAKMSESTAKKLSFSADERVRFIRLDGGKLNFQLLDPEAKWFRMDSITIPNGDVVGSVKPVNLAPLFERSKGEDRRVKWTPTLVAEALHRILKDNEIAFNEIQGQFEQDNDIKDRQARKCATMISNDEKEPTCIQVEGAYFEYWYSKKRRNASIMIHRRAL